MINQQNGLKLKVLGYEIIRITGGKKTFKTRSVGALWAPTSSWRSFGPLDFVLRALRALRTVLRARLTLFRPGLQNYTSARGCARWHNICLLVVLGVVVGLGLGFWVGEGGRS